MKTLLYCLFCLLSAHTQHPTCVDWNNAENFDFYKVQSGKPFGKLTWTEIDKQPHVRLNEAKQILIRSICKPIKAAVWKDQDLLVVSFKNGERKKFIVSSMEVFLVELGGKRYELSGADQEKWSAIIDRYKLDIYNQSHKPHTR